jgi:hypothetical protein
MEQPNIQRTDTAGKAGDVAVEAVQAQPKPHQPKATGVMVLLTAKPGVTGEQVMKIMPPEIRATVRLYLDGTIRQWYSRADGKGVVLFLDRKDAAEAHAVMDSLPLSKEHLMDHEYIPIGPLAPLGALLGEK